MKPYVICHMCTSIDGRILASRWNRVPTGARTGGAVLGDGDRLLQLRQSAAKVDDDLHQPPHLGQPLVRFFGRVGP